MSEEAQIRVDTTEDTPVVRTVSVEVPEPQVRKAIDRTYKNLAKGAQVKGFRRGKVPRKVLERVYGAQADEEIERMLVSETLADAIEMAEIEPVTEPDIDATPPVAGSPFQYSARVEVKPVIDLPKLKGLKATKPSTDIDDSKIDARIETMRENFAPLVELEEGVGAEQGDTVHVDFEGRVDGELFDGGAGEDMAVEIGGGRLIPGFEDQLVGVVTGEDRDLNVTFPEDYGEASLAGKDAVFAIKAVAIKRKTLPEIDDEFAKDVGEDSLEALKEKIRGELSQQAESQAQNQLRQTLMDSLIEATDFEVPPGLVHRQLHQQMQSMKQQFQGQVPEEVLQQELSRMHDSGRDAAERRVREALLLDAVVRSEGIEVDESEIEAKLDELAEAQGSDPAVMRTLAEQQGWRGQIEAEILDGKALDFLTAGASVEAAEGD
ncbi:MAG: trigger factor [Myxococcota bacterium]|nr:trigger factor [Myxococcota bacterium]